MSEPKDVQHDWEYGMPDEEWLLRVIAHNLFVIAERLGHTTNESGRSTGEAA